MKLPVNEIICDHNIRAIRKFPDNSIDSIITDPPYGLGFMGKEWDTFKQSHLRKRKEYIETKRPSRVDGTPASRIAFTLSAEAGSYDFSRNKEFQKWFTRWAKECLRVAKPGAFMLVFGGTRTFHRLTCAIEDAGWQIRDCMMWLYGSGFPKSHNIGKAIEKQKVGGIKNLKQIGTKKGIKVETGTQGYSYNKEYVAGKCMGGKQISGDIPVYEINNEWGGYGTALKPAWEPIIVAMKPVDGNFAKNAEKYGVAGLNIDGGRIEGDVDLHNYTANRKCKIKGGWGFKGEKGTELHSQGRWPVNVILDEESAAMLDLRSGISESKIAERGKGIDGRTFKNPNGIAFGIRGHSDSGGASRFFYIAKAGRGERNAGCGGLENKTKIFRPGEALGGQQIEVVLKDTNFHPTVKPLSLMKYLCMLLKMPNRDQIILDPFMGSGTTCIACKELGINYIGIDNEKDYCKIARARLKNVRLTLFEKPVKKIKKKKKVRRRLL